MRADSEIGALLEALLESGVAPRYVSRLASELEDHFHDLEAEARRFGIPPDEAAADARRRLGASSAIANEFAKRPELRSWIHRSPWLAALLRALVAVYVGAAAPFRAAFGEHGVMLRYTAATAVGTGVTLGLLLLMTLMLSPVASGIEFGNGGDAAVRPKLDESLRVRPPRPAGEPAAAAARAPVRDRRETAALGVAATPPRAPQWTPSARPSAPERRVAFEPAGEPFWTSRPVVTPSFSASDPRAFVATLQPSLDPRAFVTMLQPSLDPREFRPVVQRPPSYPAAAARRGLEGYVVVEYTVTRHGEVQAPVIVESSSSIFHEAALEAASGLRYQPRVIGGETVDVVGVRTVIRFELEV